MAHLEYNDSDGEDCKIPSVIVVKKTTLLCRWDNGCGEGNSDDDITLSSSDDEQRPCIQCQASPPRSPTRRPTPPALKERRKTIKSGVDIGSVNLLPIQFSQTGDVLDEESKLLPNHSLANILQNNPGDEANKMTAVFCIRRPGCGSCRDHGQQLARLMRKLDFSFNLVGIIKETGVDDEGLSNFYKGYFPFPLYKDEKRCAFRFLGNRKMTVWQLLRGHMKMKSYYEKHGIENIPFGGDLFTQGGILLFDKDGQLRYIYYERYGEEFDVDAIELAIQDCQREPRQNRNAVDAPKRPARRQSHTKAMQDPPKRPARRQSNEFDATADVSPKRPTRYVSKIGAAIMAPQ